MSTIIQRRRPSLAVLASLGMLGAFPSFARGQLLPNLPLHARTKPPCTSESPALQMVRREYYGYHPTCWRKFPAGWGCPSPEAPNAAAAFAERKRDRPNPNLPDGSDELPAANPDMPDMPAERPGPGMDERTNPAFPALPSGGNRSPFELDTNPSTPKPGPGNSPRGPERPGLDGGPTGSPLDAPTRPAPGAATRAARRRQPTLTSNSSTMDAPSFPDATPPLSSSASIDPLPGSIASPPALGDVGGSDEDAFGSSPKPQTASKRQGLLAGLFGNANTRRR